jgi:GNAT superfamily N-acetyltransferase
VQIRPAESEDWAAIYPFFAAIVAAGETYAYPEGMSSEEARALWMEPSPWQVLVAASELGVLGTAKVGPNRPGRGSHVATASFMVDPAAAGRGVGRSLGEYALAWARDAGYASMQFNAVVETNTSAVRLWTSLGFTIIGTVPAAFESATHGRVGLHVMHRHL